MKHFRKIWDEGKNAFLKTTKGMPRKEAYKLFREKYPDADVTETAVSNQRSRLGVSIPSHHNSRKVRPLYAEQIKKGYVRIKVAQPNVWMSKAKWVYMETHPWEDFSARSNYIFLDGNNRNFAPENIERVELKYMGIFNYLGGTAENAELTRLRLTQAKLKHAIYDRAEELGQIVIYANGRRFRSDVNAYARKQREKNREKLNEQQKRRYHENNGKEKQREYRARKICTKK